MLKFKTKLSLAVAQRPMYTQGGPLCDPPTAHSGGRSGERRNNREKETIPNIQTTKNVLARFRLLAGKDFYNFFSII